MHDIKWNFTEWYCQKCGKQTIIELPGIDEDNAGWQHLCFSCGFGFMSPGEDYTDLYDNEKTAVMTSAQQAAVGRGHGCRSCELGLCPDGNGGYIPCTICGNTVQPKTVRG